MVQDWKVASGPDNEKGYAQPISLRPAVVAKEGSQLQVRIRKWNQLNESSGNNLAQSS